VVDALLGTGFHPPVSGPYSDAIAAINATDAPVIAVDIPSGADADVMGEQTGAVVRADAIVSHAPVGACIGMLTSGDVSSHRLTGRRDRLRPSTRPDYAARHRSAGWALARPWRTKAAWARLVIGGSSGKAGARRWRDVGAAQRRGLSTWQLPSRVLATVAGFHPELMTEPLQETSGHDLDAGAGVWGVWMNW